MAELINSVVRAAAAGDAAAGHAALDGLAELTRRHFEDEKALLRRLGRPGIEAHHQHQQGIERHLLNIRARTATRAPLPPDAAEYLQAWFLSHLFVHDLPLRRFLDEKGVTRQPRRPPPRWRERMTRGLDLLSLRTRILLLAVLPLLAVVALGLIGIGERARTAGEMRTLRDVTVFSTRIGALVHELQKERGFSALVLGGDAEHQGGLGAQRLATDRRNNEFSMTADRIASALDASEAALRHAKQVLAGLAGLRIEVDAGRLTAEEAMAYYSRAIAELLSLIRTVVYTRAVDDLGKDASAYLNLMQAKERAGIERALGAASLAGGRLDAERYHDFVALIAEQRLLENAFLSVAGPRLADYYRGMVESGRGRVEEMRNRMLSGAISGLMPAISAEEWFKAATARIDLLKSAESEMADHIIGTADAVFSEARRQILWLGLGLLIILAGIVLPTMALAWSVVPPLTGLISAVTALAGGNRAVAVPELAARDEIGDLARAVDAFRRHLILADLLSTQGRFEIVERLRSVADHLAGVVFQWASDGDEARFTYVSGKSGEYFAAAPEDLLGQSSAALLDAVEEQDREAFRIDLAAALKTREGLETEIRISAANGEARWLHLRAAPRMGPDGGVLWDGLALDVTELKKAEEQRNLASAKLRQFYKMQSLSQLAGGIAHEINNMLQPILGLTEIALRTLPETARERPLLENVLRATGQARQLIDKVTSFGRLDGLQRERLILVEVVEDAMGVLKAVVPKNIRLETRLEAREAPVEANGTEIQQVLMNLYTNAIQAMPPHGGRITVSTEVVKQLPAVGIRPHGWVRLRVADTGCGIGQEALERIFDPFFTTKEVGQGTGLGLALVHSIVTGFGGQIDVSSVPGQGTTFDLYFPIAEAAETAEALPLSTAG